MRRHRRRAGRALALALLVAVATIGLAGPGIAAAAPADDAPAASEPASAEPATGSSLEPRELSLRGEDTDVVVGVLAVSASPDADACVWLESADIPGGSGEVAVRLGGGAESDVTCELVPAGSRAEVPVVVAFADAASAVHRGEITIALEATSDGEVQLVTVAVVVELVAAVDPVPRALVTFALVLLGFAVAPVLVWLGDVVFGRFRPRPDLEIIDRAVFVRRDGGVFRPGAFGGPLTLADESWSAAELDRTRGTTWRGLTLRVHSVVNPFSRPTGLVSGPAPTAASDGVIEHDGTLIGGLPLRLGAGWVFVVDADATRRAAADPTSADFFGVYGRLVVFRSPSVPLAELEDELRAVLPGRAFGLGQVVRSDRRVDEATGQEMLDFIDANVTTVRGLPRLARHDLDADASATAPVGATPESLYDFTDLGEFAKYVDVDVDAGAAPVAAAAADDDEEAAAGWGPAAGADEPEVAPDLFVDDPDEVVDARRDELVDDEEPDADLVTEAGVADDDTAETEHDGEESDGPPPPFDPTALRVEGGVAWRSFDSPADLAPGAVRAVEAVPVSAGDDEADVTDGGAYFADLPWPTDDAGDEPAEPEPDTDDDPALRWARRAKPSWPFPPREGR